MEIRLANKIFETLYLCVSAFYFGLTTSPSSPAVRILCHITGAISYKFYISQCSSDCDAVPKNLLEDVAQAKAHSYILTDVMCMHVDNTHDL